MLTAPVVGVVLVLVFWCVGDCVGMLWLVLTVLVVGVDEWNTDESPQLQLPTRALYPEHNVGVGGGLLWLV